MLLLKTKKELLALLAKEGINTSYSGHTKTFYGDIPVTNRASNDIIGSGYNYIMNE